MTLTLQLYQILLYEEFLLLVKSVQHHNSIKYYQIFYFIN